MHLNPLQSNTCKVRFSHDFFSFWFVLSEEINFTASTCYQRANKSKIHRRFSNLSRYVILIPELVKFSSLNLASGAIQVSKLANCIFIASITYFFGTIIVPKYVNCTFKFLKRFRNICMYTFILPIGIGVVRNRVFEILPYNVSLPLCVWARVLPNLIIYKILLIALTLASKQLW